MAADAILPKLFNLQFNMVEVGATKVTQNDWLNLSKAGLYIKGIAGAILNTCSNSANVAETWTYGTLTINNSGTAYTATDTTIVVGSGLYGTGTNPRVVPYYIRAGSGEILEVTADSLPLTAAGTLTVRRGCLGTTASATGLAHTNVVHVLNQIILTSSTVGPVQGVIFPMPDAATPFA